MMQVLVNILKNAIEATNENGEIQIDFTQRRGGKTVIDSVSVGTRYSQHVEKNGIHHCWSRIRNIMSSQTVVTTRMKLENKDCLVLRNVTHPNMEQKKIYTALKFKQTNPKMKKKVVVPHK